MSIRNAEELTRKLGQVVYVAGAQWGDEGKGKLVDILSQKYDIIARAAGGANAGHTICVNKNGKSEKFIFHQLPSGVLHEGKICIIGNGCVIHIATLLDEIHQLREKGIDVMRQLMISDRAHIIFDYHKEIDEIQEDRKGDKKVGTTKRGIGPAYTDKISRSGIRMADLLDFDGFAAKFRANAERKMKLFGIKIDIEKQINFYKDAVELIQPLIINTIEYLEKAYKEGKTILVEGAQGSHLDIDFGTYPYVTSSSTTSGGACTGLGIAPSKISSVVGIAKAYTTRVGAGPFPTELGDIEGTMLRDKGAEFGATTGRPRRCGWFDAVVVKNAITISGINSINLTKLDVLTGFQNIKIAVGYKLDGENISFVPALLNEFERVEVKYIDMPGWTEDISDAKKFMNLPKNARNYVLKLEEILEVPVNFIGVGVHRNEMIYR
ncbi:adenylosuccinate synthase [Patescibacteria group bacterium]|nr:adenylosuccinate synthase [Patescibacteria group bacterium]MBU1015621.1 adenylosuccinate synthase [Patescibacteria group bacterium]MBU1685330.1 adenylosuccinate synthase [Patescibacteria group bacterium]MBU1938756.1 adenylosuccinate synthase [Patescibacteria group bacterium]